MYILLRYPFLIDVNAKNEKQVDSINDKSQFFVIKSFSEEDVHKAIKYNVWTSTKSGNQTLNNAYKVSQENNSYVYLFFSCNGSGRYVGIARMKSPVEYNKCFPYWTQDNKWGGLFELEWILIKDTPFRIYKDIVIMMKDGERKCISFSRDTQEVPHTEGMGMVSLMKDYVHSNTILEHFEYYDLRQENYEKSHPMKLESMDMK
jgi:hypothetical protein